MKHTGLEFKNLSRSASKSLDYTEKLQGSHGGFGYKSPPSASSGYNTLTGVGVLCLQMWDKGSSKAVRSGIKYINENTELKWGTPNADLYGHYYEAQAMMNRGGQDWKKYNGMMRDEVLKNQLPDGTWKVPEGKLRAVAPVYQRDTFYRTALCTLMLEVYYRFLPSAN
jgi:hypothetical protein